MEGWKIFLLVALTAPLSGGKDLVWKPNSNWGNPNNWASGSVPACGESVSLRNVRPFIYSYYCIRHIIFILRSLKSLLST